MLDGKTIVLGVTGSIAAYKIASLASMLVKLHAKVHVIMTKNAEKFMSPITFETLTNTKCLIETFDRNFQPNVTHISIAQQADLMLIAPATANIIGKLAGGMADDMLTTTVIACKAPILVSPAMNTNMFENSIVQENLFKLKQHGIEIIDPASGRLACGDTGKGKMPEPEILLDYILKTIAYEKDLIGKKVLVTAGATREAIDPVRYITNHSTGKMGYEIAKAAMLRGADVTLVSGKTSITYPPFIKTISIVSADEMFEAVKELFEEQDIVVMSAAIADYRPKQYVDYKIKKTDNDLSIELERTVDVLGTIAQKKKKHQFICGFSMETENLLENSKKKCESKKLDLIAANNLRQEGAGFETDTNILTLISEESAIELPLLSKEKAAHYLLDEIYNKLIKD